jgi:hypothetical protein
MECMNSKRSPHLSTKLRLNMHLQGICQRDTFEPLSCWNANAPCLRGRFVWTSPQTIRHSKTNIFEPKMTDRTVRDLSWRVCSQMSWPRISTFFSWNESSHYGVHTIPPLDTTLRTGFRKIHFNIILPYCSLLSDVCSSGNVGYHFEWISHTICDCWPTFPIRLIFLITLVNDRLKQN